MSLAGKIVIYVICKENLNPETTTFNKETQDALSSIQLKENPRFDDYYLNKMIDHAIKTLKKIQDGSTLDEDLKEKIEQKYLPKVAIKMNIFHKNNHMKYLRAMIEKVEPTEDKMNSILRN